MAVTEARIAAIEKCQQEHDAWINGNGKPGAKVQFKSLEDGLKSLGDDVTEIKELLKTLIGWAVGLIVTVIGAAAVFFLLNVIPHVAK